jgi:hypothetical protein
MDFWYNNGSGALEWIIRPYQINNNGEQEFSRSSPKISRGDILHIYSRSIDTAGALHWNPVGQVVWSEDTKVQKKPMPCGKYGLEVIAIDLAGNTGESGIIPYNISC